jgi:hypothetical protein
MQVGLARGRRHRVPLPSRVGDHRGLSLADYDVVGIVADASLHPAQQVVGRVLVLGRQVPIEWVGHHLAHAASVYHPFRWWSTAAVKSRRARCSAGAQTSHRWLTARGGGVRASVRSDVAGEHNAQNSEIDAYFDHRLQERQHCKRAISSVSTINRTRRTIATGKSLSTPRAVLPVLGSAGCRRT